jgi:protein Tex
MLRCESRFNPVPFVSADLGISIKQVIAVGVLLAEGNTIPFIARYRKEAHGNLDEVQIQDIQEKIQYYTSLEDRRQTILKEIDSQGKLTDELRGTIEKCLSKTELEDLYLPYKPKRRTRATIAREKGLEPLAELILAQPTDADLEQASLPFVDAAKDVQTVADALAGARDIAAEVISEHAGIRAAIREAYFKSGEIVSVAAKADAVAETSKFKDYFDFRQAIGEIPSHRFLAIRRGETEGELRRTLVVDPAPLLETMRAAFHLDEKSPFAGELEHAIVDAFRRLIVPGLEMDVLIEMKMKADRAAVEVFARNLRNLLLAAPFGQKPVIGIDPGVRTGCKCAAVDATGKYLDSVTIYPGQGAQQHQRAQIDLGAFVNRYKPMAIAVGNGTGGRETEAFARDVLALMKCKDVNVIAVSEAGASVYSASPIAREEFPDLDLTIRGAISIARRLQDPLAELVKVDPKAIGVGQYQHDVYQELLKTKLDEVVVSCVNHVGVELNTASAPLLSRIAGIGESLSRKIVAHRDAHGPFGSRKALLEVSGLGPRAFEQAAGFLRIRGGAHPLDASAVHPERYVLVEQMAQDAGIPLAELVGNAVAADQIALRRYVSDEVGEPTLRDIISELKKPGRDPREQFESAGFREDVNSLDDLVTGMELNGIVTNVTAFGAFVDVGVHQDGLIHVSQLCDRFVSDPAEVVQAGARIKVRVLEVDLARKRISLTARSKSDGVVPSAAPSRGDAVPRKGGSDPRARQSKPQVARTFANNPFAGL